MRDLRDPKPGRAVSLPAVGRLVNEPAYAELVRAFGRERVVEAIREQIAAERAGAAVDSMERSHRVGEALRSLVAPRLRHVINASGRRFRAARSKP